MAEKQFNQTFQGYWREANKSGLPEKSGVYFVYECKHNTDTTPTTVSILKLIYIGKADNAKSRIATHDKHKDWMKHVRQGNELCYSFTEVDFYDVERVEAAYIYRHQPPENIEYKNAFPFDKTIVKSDPKDKIALLKDYFVVNRT